MVYRIDSLLFFTVKNIATPINPSWWRTFVFSLQKVYRLKTLHSLTDVRAMVEQDSRLHDKSKHFFPIKATNIVISKPHFKRPIQDNDKKSRHGLWNQISHLCHNESTKIIAFTQSLKIFFHCLSNCNKWSSLCLRYSWETPIMKQYFFCIKFPCLWYHISSESLFTFCPYIRQYKGISNINNTDV